MIEQIYSNASVKDFGAVGDNVTDDTAAIQAAIDSAGGLARVHFPPGIYRVTESLRAYACRKDENK